jgi:hypothetical protein
VLRFALCLVLIAVLASCPIVCGAVEASLGLRDGTHGPVGDGDHPVPYPVNDDDCVCNGALKSDDAAPVAALLIGLLATLDLGFDTPGFLPGFVPSPLCHPAFAPADHNGPGSSCARLQPFRC